MAWYRRHAKAESAKGGWQHQPVHAIVRVYMKLSCHSSFLRHGTNAFHLVALRGGGWAAQPADDAAEPLLAFCLDEDAALPDPDDGCPGWGFLAYCAGMDVLTSLHDDIYGEEAFENGYVCGSDRPSFTLNKAVGIARRVRVGQFQLPCVFPAV